MLRVDFIVLNFIELVMFACCMLHVDFIVLSWLGLCVVC